MNTYSIVLTGLAVLSFLATLAAGWPMLLVGVSLLVNAWIAMDEDEDEEEPT